MWWGGGGGGGGQDPPPEDGVQHTSPIPIRSSIHDTNILHSCSKKFIGVDVLLFTNVPWLTEWFHWGLKFFSD